MIQYRRRRRMSDPTHVSTWPNRTLCDVLEEMRKCHESRNYAYLLSLIEEVQTFGNRMEAALSNQKDFTQMDEALHKLKKQYKPLRDEILKLRDEKEELEEAIKKLKGEKDTDDADE